MKITIINGAPDDRFQPFIRALHALGDALGEGYDVTVFDIKDLNINYCVGCFKCWIKTPGRCVFKDDMEQILASKPAADLMLYATPVTAGTMTALTKKVLDRSIPLVLPYIRNYQGECHHPQRYENRPDIGILLFDDGRIDKESKEILFALMDRLSKNFRADRVLKLSAPPEKIAEVLKHEISAH